MGFFLQTSFLCMLVHLNKPSDCQRPSECCFLCLTTANQAQAVQIWGGEFSTAEFCLFCMHMQGMQLFHFLYSNTNTGLKKKKKGKEKLDGWMFLQIKVQSSKAKYFKTMYNKAFFFKSYKSCFMKLSWKYYKWEMTTE